ncbi:crotonase/enoyl-CoA hydratase family protein [Ideonella sp. BN130291]|uniref:crotonase/enoyl-CoA hydratase family protein n=1 Tax=Ideonella sp. BN130291 TaxID=3112940 RepID=UPI002E26163F|nr:crotonase/enoyl-CoA hydratase family protein [Ideonella sp. BN130291]
MNETEANDVLSEFQPAGGLLAELSLLRVECAGPLFHLRLNRPAKRNAINDTLVRELQTAFVHLPKQARVVVISGEGAHFSAGLDLSEVTEQDVVEGVFHSRAWHAAFEQIQYGPVPVIAALHGAVVGGGLELAATAHLRVADQTAFFALPEGQRGIFVGGSGSVRISRLIGVSRMTDMMLTGRVLDATEAEAASLVNYRVPEGQALAKALELAHKVAANAPLSNYAVTQALPRIAEMAPGDGLFLESLMSAIAQGDEAAKQRVRDFLAKRAGKVGKAA